MPKRYHYYAKAFAKKNHWNSTSKTEEMWNFLCRVVFLKKSFFLRFFFYATSKLHKSTLNLSTTMNLVKCDEIWIFDLNLLLDMKIRSKKRRKKVMHARITRKNCANRKSFKFLWWKTDNRWTSHSIIFFFSEKVWSHILIYNFLFIVWIVDSKLFIFPFFYSIFFLVFISFLESIEHILLMNHCDGIISSF